MKRIKDWLWFNVITKVFESYIKPQRVHSQAIAISHNLDNAEDAEALKVLEKHVAEDLANYLITEGYVTIRRAAPATWEGLDSDTITEVIGTIVVLKPTSKYPLKR